MKRSALARGTSQLRRTPLARGVSKLSRSAPIARTSGLTRTSMKRKPTKPLSRGEKAHRAAVRLMPCCACGKPGPSQYSHVTLNANSKGHGMKTAHGVPHCGTTIDGTGCHEQWDQRKGRFAGMSKEMRYEQAACWVRLVMLALTPEDFDQALQFKELGLGSIGTNGNGWTWVPTIPAMVSS